MLELPLAPPATLCFCSASSGKPLDRKLGPGAIVLSPSFLIRDEPYMAMAQIKNAHLWTLLSTWPQYFPFHYH